MTSSMFLQWREIDHQTSDFGGSHSSTLNFLHQLVADKDIPVIEYRLMLTR